jgi:hypothetical protein
MPRCPTCKGAEFHRSRPRWYDYLLLIPPRRAYRCVRCDRRLALWPWQRPRRLPRQGGDRHPIQVHFGIGPGPPPFCLGGGRRAGWRGRKSCRAIAPGLTPAGSARAACRHQGGPGLDAEGGPDACRLPARRAGPLARRCFYLARAPQERCSNPRNCEKCSCRRRGFGGFLQVQPVCRLTLPPPPAAVC